MPLSASVSSLCPLSSKQACLQQPCWALRGSRNRSRGTSFFQAAWLCKHSASPSRMCRLRTACMLTWRCTASHQCCTNAYGYQSLSLLPPLSHSSTGCCRSSWHETSLLRTPTPTRPLRSSGSTMILVTDPFLQSCVKVVGSRSLTPRGQYICSTHRHQGQQSSYTPPIPISISISISHREDSPALV